MAKIPKGWRLGGLVDVASTAKDVEKLWKTIEERFPPQSGDQPVAKGRQWIFYSKNGKARRTRCVRLLEKLAVELGSLAGDVREAHKDEVALTAFGMKAPRASSKKKNGR